MSTGLQAFSYGGLMFLLAVSLFKTSGLVALGVSMAVPALLLTFLGTAIGVAADRYSKRRVLRISLGCLGTAGVIGLIGAVLNSPLSGVAFIASYILAGVALAGGATVTSILIPLHFDDDELESANAAVQTASIVAMICAPLVMQLFRAKGSQAIAFGVAIVFLGVAYAATSRLREDFPQSSNRVPESRAHLNVLKGILKNRDLVVVTSALSVTWLGIGAVNALEVPFLTKKLGAGAGGYAFSLAFGACWMLLGATSYSRISARLGVDRVFVISLAGSGIAWGAFGLAPSYAIALIAVAIGAVFGSTLNISGFSLIQRAASRGESLGAGISYAMGAFHFTGAVGLMVWSIVASYGTSVGTALVLSGGLGACGALIAVSARLDGRASA